MFVLPSQCAKSLLFNHSLVVIMGTSERGIGAATVIALAHGKPRTLFLTGRNVSKTAPVIEAIRNIDPDIKAIFINLDLTDQDSIREAARTVLESGEAEKIHGLINYAGVITVWVSCLR
jgi:NAD(P)-dependent dehydrogenase (short-subunit alcohol dehydrogenase family)